MSRNENVQPYRYMFAPKLLRNKEGDPSRTSRRENNFNQMVSPSGYTAERQAPNKALADTVFGCTDSFHRTVAKCQVSRVRDAKGVEVGGNGHEKVPRVTACEGTSGRTRDMYSVR